MNFKCSEWNTFKDINKKVNGVRKPDEDNDTVLLIKTKLDIAPNIILDKIKK